MRAVVRLPMLLMLCAGCSGGSTDGAATRADTLTRAQKDSIIGASSLPGAGAVRRAIGTADSVAARQSTLDSLLRQ
jgi:hypothetical protein